MVDHQSAPLAPSRAVLLRAEATNREHGHENAGALSEASGFVPAQPPLGSMPPSHRAWDEAAECLPDRIRTLTLRRALDAMPLLSAEADALPDRYLGRASLLLSQLAHTYYWIESAPPESVPACIQTPWEQVTRRLGRPAPFLSYHDIFLYNWQIRDPALPDPMRLENLDLLIPSAGNQAERVFLLAQVEMTAQAAPITGAAVRAQEAVLRGDVPALRDELLIVIERLQHITNHSFLKIDTNPHSRTYVDPVVWSKTVARYAIPIKEGIPGPSGSAAPLFQLLDVFLGRAEYDSVLGKDTLHFRRWYPRHHAEFLEAVAAVSVREFVERSGDPCLKGIFHSALDAYIGDKGFLGAHRLKVYGFLETAYKVGRSMTTGGFAGSFKERPWEGVDEALETARRERYEGMPAHCYYATIKSSGKTDEAADDRVKHVVLNTDGAGVRYEPGDRVGIMPENSDELVDKTLRALRATGEEPIRLDGAWQAAMRLERGYEGMSVLPLRILLTYGKIRPVLRPVAKTLHAMTASSRLKEIIDARAEDQWELWDLLEVLGEAGFDPRRLWKAEPWEAESVCKVVPPEVHRMYSVSCAMEPSDDDDADELHLTVGSLRYETRDAPGSRADTRYGTASHFISRIIAKPADGDDRIALRIVRPPRFRLPQDPARPVVMFAGGAGISPFRGFLQERARQAGAGENWLFFGARSRRQFFYRQEIERLVARGRLEVRVAFSADDASVRYERRGDDDGGGGFIFDPGRKGQIDAVIEDEENARQLWDLIRTEADGGREAYLYVCGQTGFAVTVMNALKNVLRRFAPGPDEAARDRQAKDILYRLVADDRYMQDIFTTYSPASREATGTYHASDVALHNDPEHGYWMVVSGKVYDVTEFLNLHPGGEMILMENAGLDATLAYRAVQHHVNSEVDAMLGMYEIGSIARLDFSGAWGVAVGPQGLFYVSVEEAFLTWVRFLYFVVEMENALAGDFRFRDRVLTREPDNAELSPLKTLLLIESHQRFLAYYFVGAFGEDLQKLWAITTGLCAPRESVQRLQQEIDAVNASPEARVVRESPELLKRIHRRLLGPETGSDVAAQARIQAVCLQAEQEDKRFLAEMKSVIRDGVKVFEEHGAGAVGAGRERLLESLRRVPGVLERYHTALAPGLEALQRMAPHD